MGKEQTPEEKIAILEAEIQEAQATLEKVSQERDTLKDENEALKESQEALVKTIEDMQAKVDEASTEKEDAKSKTEILTIGKKKFEVLKPAFRLDGVVHKTTDLKNHPELLERLLSVKGQRIINPKSK
ncbi:MAG: hypothetical protein LPK47_02660 [Bacteroidota bacterium]|nr:hypothetical protein [Bacteroidota bacterium]